MIEKCRWNLNCYELETFVLKFAVTMLDVFCRALEIDMHCIEAMEYQVLQMLCREGNYSEVSIPFEIIVDKSE